VVGGVEAVMAEHARLLLAAGFEVTFVAGQGEQASLPERATLVTIPEADSHYPANLEIAEALTGGQVPPAFGDLAWRIEAALASALAGCDVVLAHNVITMQFNLPLLAALHRLVAGEHHWKMAAWCHDVSRYVRPSSGAPQRFGYPWDLLRACLEEVAYVAVSALRQRHLAEAFGCAPDRFRVIGNGVDEDVLLGLSGTGRHLAEALGLLAADLVMLMPVRITQAKNIEFALELTAWLKRAGLRPLLVITGPPDPHAPDGLAYFDRLRALRRDLGLTQEAHFAYEGTLRLPAPLRIEAPVVGELYRLADLVLMPSHREGFGLPVLEACLLGRPVFATQVPALDEIGEGVHLIGVGETAESVAGRIAQWAAQDGTHRLRRQVRQSHTWSAIFDRRILPLLDELVGR
jgi:glycosyltransferase involved in cell wall biosynthesis